MTLAEKLKIRRQAIELLESAGMREKEEPLVEDTPVEEPIEDSKGEVIVCESEEEFLAAIGEQEGPIAVTHSKVEAPIEKKRKRTLHALYDAKPPERVREEAEGMDLERWSKVVARLDRDQNVKVDHNITAMALVGMFPVAVEGD